MPSRTSTSSRHTCTSSPSVAPSRAVCDATASGASTRTRWPAWRAHSSCILVFPSPVSANSAARPRLSAHTTSWAWNGNSDGCSGGTIDRPTVGRRASFCATKSSYVSVTTSSSLARVCTHGAHASRVYRPPLSHAACNAEQHVSEGQRRGHALALAHALGRAPFLASLLGVPLEPLPSPRPVLRRGA